MTLYLVAVAVAVTGLRRWSSRDGWSPRHQLALAAGALAPHLTFALLQRSLVEVPLWVDLFGDIAFAGVVLAVFLAGWRSLGLRRGRSDRRCYSRGRVPWPRTSPTEPEL